MNQAPREERSFGDLLADLFHEVTDLVRQEVALARREISEKAGKLGTGIAALGVGGLLAFAGLLVLLDALVLKLSDKMSPALSALIVGGIVAAIGIFLLLRGKNNLSSESLVPRRTAESLRRDGALVRDRLT